MIFRRNLRVVLFLIVGYSLCLIGKNAYSEVIDKVMVVVNDEIVTQREFDRTFSGIQKKYEENFKGDELDRRLEAAREGLLEQLVNSKLTISLAKQEEIEIDEEELTNRISKVKEFYDTEDEFLRALNEKGTNLSEFERELKEQMLAQKLVEQEVASKIIITPADIKDLFEKNKKQLISPNRVRVRSIMVRKVDDLVGEGKKGSDKEKIDSIVSELEAGKDFATLATERSEGPYAEKGGDMGYVTEGQLIKSIDDVVFKLEEGSFSDVVETSIGYHLFFAEEVEEAHALEFEEVSDFLREQLYMRQFEEKLVKWLEEKREAAYIVYK